MDKSLSSPVAGKGSAPPSPAGLRNWELLRSSLGEPYSLSKKLPGKFVKMVAIAAQTFAT